MLNDAEAASPRLFGREDGASARQRRKKQEQKQRREKRNRKKERKKKRRERCSHHHRPRRHKTTTTAFPLRATSPSTMPAASLITSPAPTSPLRHARLGARPRICCCAAHLSTFPDRVVPMRRTHIQRLCSLCFHTRPRRPPSHGNRCPRHKRSSHCSTRLICALAAKVLYQQNANPANRGRPDIHPPGR